ncbi:hypothetical protein W02_31880 [Nitrospira sp. KM1]|uniref:tetratricopeptide repeat protein n=1 Tax=Nitrospira sp. KM1 TaxID=1936990 RepID=UPI0013A77045|nr:tetratricopeptide repeat protein [Nitrospira sp. KM1]BCA56048.1 hypothetical protein W02_31880 [Nitrospira sp. KM1]
MPSVYSAADISRILSLPLSGVRRCVRAALLPAPRSTSGYSFQDLILIRTCRSLIGARIPVTRIRRLLQSLKNQIPQERHLSTIRIYADGRRIVVWDGTAHWQPDSGQFLFAFDAAEFPGPAGEPKALQRTPKRTAAQWYLLGKQLDETSGEEARKAYEEALRIDPAYRPALIQLGSIYCAEGRWREAEQSFREASRSDPRDAHALYSLGHVLEQLKKPRGAVKAYRQAIICSPRFYEAHYRLGLLYESLGKKTDAIRHFNIARRLRKQT